MMLSDDDDDKIPDVSSIVVPREMSPLSDDDDEALPWASAAGPSGPAADSAAPAGKEDKEDKEEDDAMDTSADSKDDALNTSVDSTGSAGGGGEGARGRRKRETKKVEKFKPAPQKAKESDDLKEMRKMMATHKTWEKEMREIQQIGADNEALNEAKEKMQKMMESGNDHDDERLEDDDGDRIFKDVPGFEAPKLAELGWSNFSVTHDEDEANKVMNVLRLELERDPSKDKGGRFASEAGSKWLVRAVCYHNSEVSHAALKVYTKLCKEEGQGPAWAPDSDFFLSVLMDYGLDEGAIPADIRAKKRGRVGIYSPGFEFEISVGGEWCKAKVGKYDSKAGVYSVSYEDFEGEEVTVLTENFPMENQRCSAEKGQGDVDDKSSDDGYEDPDDYINHQAVIQHGVPFLHLLSLSLTGISQSGLVDSMSQNEVVSWLFLLLKMRIDPTISRSLSKLSKNHDNFTGDCFPAVALDKCVSVFVSAIPSSMWSDQLIARICKDVLTGEALTSNQNARSIAVSAFGAGPRQDAMTRAGFEALLRFQLGSGEAAKSKGAMDVAELFGLLSNISMSKGTKITCNGAAVGFDFVHQALRYVQGLINFYKKSGEDKEDAESIQAIMTRLIKWKQNFSVGNTSNKGLKLSMLLMELTVATQTERMQSKLGRRALQPTQPSVADAFVQPEKKVQAMEEGAGGEGEEKSSPAKKQRID